MDFFWKILSYLVPNPNDPTVPKWRKATGTFVAVFIVAPLAVTIMVLPVVLLFSFLSSGNTPNDPPDQTCYPSSRC
jgi:hypothetical protein